MKTIASVMIVATFVSATIAHARPNAGAPAPTGASTVRPAPSVSEFMANFEPRFERVKALPEGETRDANILSLLAELATVLTPLASSVEIDAAQVVRTGVLEFAEGYRQLNTTARVLPPNHPAVQDLKAAMELLTHNLSDLDAASTQAANQILSLNSSLASAKGTLLARNQGRYLVGPAQVIFDSVNTLTVGFTAFNTYEKACATQILSAKTALFTTGVSANANARVAQVNSACVTQQPYVDPSSFGQLQSRIQFAVQGLRSHYQIIN